MEIHTLLMASLLAFTSPSSSASGSLPNLCDDVYLDEDGSPFHDSEGVTFPRYCEFAGPDAPRWAAPVCCSFKDGEARCTELDATGDCETDQSRMWCDHGERLRDGSVSCYRPLLSACDYIPCFEAPAGAVPTEGNPLCCQNGVCYELAWGELCGAQLLYCDAPFTNMDGSVGCADD